MSNTREIERLQALADAANNDDSSRAPVVAAMRVSPGPYLTVLSAVTFCGVLLMRSDFTFLPFVLLGIAWVAVPVMALTDRLIFDGKHLSRRGPVSTLMGLVTGQARELALADFETLETSAVRTLRRGGSVRYRYRTQISGKGKSFVLASGGKNYRRMIREMLPLIHDDKLDNRSRDLRDYLNDPSFVTRKAQLSQLAPANVLDLATVEFKLGGRSRFAAEVENQNQTPQNIERAHLLRRLGNELRVAGRLREASEAFRRALNITPEGSWLLYDFARLLRSQASAQADAQLLTRARAALRLASIRAKRDPVLLPLIGESLVECGDARKAHQVLRQAMEVDDQNFKARLCLADLALREGKLAHVIHHYQEASRISSELALARYARGEADYYLTLNNNDDYLATELRRINWLQYFAKIRRLSIKVVTASVLLAIIGGLLDSLTSNLGWSIAGSSLVIWLASVVGTHFLGGRTKPRPA